MPKTRALPSSTRQCARSSGFIRWSSFTDTRLRWIVLDISFVFVSNSYPITYEQIKANLNDRFLHGNRFVPRVCCCRCIMNDLGCRAPISPTSPPSGLSKLSADMEEHRGDGDNSRAHLAVVAGIFATGGSLLGKLAGIVDASSLLSLLLKGALLVFMIVCNTVGCTFFVKALHNSGSSLPVTIVSAATNYVCSAFVGSIVFNESTSLIWWCGTSLVLFGLILISYVPAERDIPVLKEKLKYQ